MSRKLLRNGLAACALAGLLAAPAHAANFGPRSVTDGLWQWLTGMWQDAIRWTIDPNGLNAPTNEGEGDIRGTIDPNGDEPNAPGGGAEGEIGLTIDPNG
jgi:hypothetical protein